MASSVSLNLLLLAGPWICSFERDLEVLMSSPYLTVPDNPPSCSSLFGKGVPAETGESSGNAPGVDTAK